MIYGLYLSATGVLTNSYRQDVIANNLANSQTVGFKRSLALFQERQSESRERGMPASPNEPVLEGIGGGLLLAPTFMDQSQGQIEMSASNLDLAINGRGFFTVRDGGQTLLTRNGKFMLDREGYMVLSDAAGTHRVLDAQSNPVQFPAGTPQSQITIGPGGQVSVEGQEVARLGFVDVPDPRLLRQRGGTLFSYPEMGQLVGAGGSIQSGCIENSNVDPMTELTQLINAHRQLEANANMIRYQDQTLAKTVNELGRIG